MDFEKNEQLPEEGMLPDEELIDLELFEEAPVTELFPEDSLSDEAFPEPLLTETLVPEAEAMELPVQEPAGDNWLDDLLETPVLAQELGPDEQAVYAAGLTHPADVELERIMEEAKTSDWDAMLDAMPDMEEDLELPQEDWPEEYVQEEPAAPVDMSDTAILLQESAALAASQPGGEMEATQLFDVSKVLDQQPQPPVPEEKETNVAPVKRETKKPQKKVPERKARPRAKKGYGFFGLPHLLASFIWLGIILAIGVSLGRTLWVCAAEVLAFGKPEMQVTITITQSDMNAENTLEIVAGKLEKAGLIDYPELFLAYAKLTDAEEEIAPGTYTLKGSDDYMALVNSMNTYSSARETIEVMIPEGYTCAQIFQLLEECGVCSAAELEEYAANGKFKDYWFLEGVERGSKYCLEGYLFPDTYEFYVGDDPGRVLAKMLGDSVGGFDVRFTDIMEEKLVALNEHLAAMMKKNGYGAEYIAEHQMTIRDITIIASMIERETTGNDRYDISSVIYNRLTNAREYPYLNIDATILYALGGKIDPETGESQPLTEADMKLDSPYNTYLYKGLPPGPICNPGVYSLLAALDPNETKYYYYVYNPAIGAHKFSETYKEHQNYINNMG